MRTIESIVSEIEVEAQEGEEEALVTWGCLGCGKTAEVEPGLHDGVTLCSKCQSCESRKENWGDTLRLAGVPPKYRVPQTLELAPILANWTGEPWCVAFLGSNGAGKTWTATRLFGHLLCQGVDLENRHRSAMWVDTGWGIDLVKRELGREGDQSETFDKIRKAPLLLLDDLGAMRETPYGAERIRLILGWRYNHLLPTIVTSDQDLEDVEPRLASRLAELSGSGESYVFDLGTNDRRQDR